MLTVNDTQSRVGVQCALKGSSGCDVTFCENRECSNTFAKRGTQLFCLGLGSSIKKNKHHGLERGGRRSGGGVGRE